jgi:hypothetical protein
MSTQDANAAVDELFGIFGQSVDDMSGIKKGEDDSEGGVKVFNPDPKKSEDGVWRGIIKFLPNIHDKKRPLAKRTTYWIEDPRGKDGHGGFQYVSPKTLGKYEKCIVADKYWEWGGKDQKDARLKALAGKLRYNKQCYALIQVLVDFQNPENNGKIMPFNLPVKIQNMIDAKMYPAQADIDAGAEAEQVFEPLLGPVMTLKVGTKLVPNAKSGKNDEFRDWEACEWHKKQIGMVVNDELIIKTAGDIKSDKIKVKVLPTDATELREMQLAIIAALKEAAPIMEKYHYVAPSEEMLKKVKEVLDVMAGMPINVDEHAEQTAANPAEQPANKHDETVAEKPAETAAPETAATTGSNLVDDIMNGMV